MLYESNPIYFEIQRDLFIQAHTGALAPFRFGEPSAAVRLVAGAAGRIGRLAAMIERWARGASESPAAPATLTRIASR
jgi:hypothetical protein